MKKHWLIAAVFAGIAAILFFTSLADFAYPGDSARLIACWKGLDVQDVPRFPVMAVFVRLLGGGNLIAPICGVVSVALLYLLIASFVNAHIRTDELVHQRERLSVIAAAVSVIVFALTPSVRSAATHLEPRLFDFTWAVLAFAVSVAFMRTKLPFFLFPIALGGLVGCGLCDSALFIALLPLYVVQVVFVSRARGRKPFVPITFFLIFLFASLRICLGVFGVDFSSFIAGTMTELRLYRTLPGWIFVVVFSLIPFLAVLLAAFKSFDEAPSSVQWMFHCAMTVASILAVATPLSPTELMRPYGIFPVVTSAFAALTSGYLASYWWLRRRSVVGIVSGSVFAFVLVVSCLWNVFSFNGDQGGFADKVAERILSDLGGRRWFVSDGTLDNHLRLLAARKGIPLHVISLSRDLDQSYLDELAKLVEKENVGGSRNGELRLSLSLGVLPFLQDWLSSDPCAAKDVAIFGAPDLWHSAGVTPIPELLFFGADEKRVPDWTAWGELDGVLNAPKGWGSYRDRKVTDPLDRLRFSLRRHVGFVANNRGVYLQDQKRDDEAWKMYELVLNQIDHDNICAVFNEVGMMGENHPSAVAKRRDLERMIKTAVDDKSRRYLLWRLGTYYGYIRNPDMFVRLGHAWAKSGRPGDALAQIRRAVDFVPSDRQSVLMNMMAALYANENEQAKSRALYERVLAKDGSDHDALVGLMRLEMLNGNKEKAAEYLQRAADASGKGGRVNVELAMVAMMRNDLATARSLLRKTTDANVKDLQAWSLLSAVTIQQIDAAKDEKEKAALEKELEGTILPMMEAQAKDPFDYYLQTTKGFLALRKGAKKRAEARDAFLAAARSRPDVVAAQDLVLGLDISLADKEGAETHARDVLRRNRKAPLANYVMGSLALGRGKTEDAEAFLRRAADAPQPVSLALNDLAEVLRRKRSFDEAERYARKAIKAAPNLYVAWETLGSVLMDAGRSLDEAEAAIRKACDLSKNENGKAADVRMLVSLARVQIQRGETLRAKSTVSQVQSRLGELTEFERQEFEKVKKEIR